LCSDERPTADVSLWNGWRGFEDTNPRLGREAWGAHQQKLKVKFVEVVEG
jgi:hypothetical protein